MATRTISTRLAIEGEAEYKRAIQSCNAEIGTLKSALALVESEFRGNANSMEALSAKGDALSAAWEKQREKVVALESALANAQAAQQSYSDRVATAQENIQRCEKALEDLKNSTGDTTREQEALTAELEGWNRELQEAERYQEAAERGVNSWQKQLNTAQVELNGLSDEIEQNNGYLAEAQKSADGCATSIDRFGKGIKDAGQAIDTLGAALVAAGVAKAISSISDAMLGCAAAAQTYETAMAKLSTLVDTTVLSMDTIGAELQSLSLQMGVSATDLSEAAYQALSASVDTADVVEFVAQATMLSKAGFTEAATAVDVLTTALNAYGLAGSETEKVASTLVKTQDLGKTSVDELAASMGRVIPTAAALGVDLDNLSAAYAILTKNGINTRIATTDLNAMFNELADDSKLVAAVLADTTGKTFTELMESGWSLSDVLEVLSNHVEGNATEFKNMWSQSTAATAALTIFNAGAEEFSETLAGMQDASGMLNRNFEIMADTTEHSQNRMNAAMEALRISVGKQLNPVMENLYELGAKAFGWMANFIEEHPGVVQGLTATATAFAALMAAFAGYTIITKVAGAFSTFTAALNPVSAAVVAVGTLATALGTLVLFSDNATTANAKLTESIRESREAHAERIADIEAEKNNVLGMIEALDTLLAAENKSSAQKEAIHGLVSQLNAAVPELGLHYDEMADSVNLSTEAIKNNALAMYEAQEQAAQVDRLTQAYIDQAKTTQELSYATEVLNAAQEAFRDGRLKDAEVVLVLHREVEKLGGTLESVTGEIATLESQIDGYTEATEAAVDGTAIMERRVDSLNAEMDQLVEQYENARAEAYKSINEQIGLWDEMDNTVKTSADTLNGALLSQIEYLENYSANMRHLIDRDIEGIEVLAQHFEDGSTESAAALAGLTEASDDEIREIIENLSRVEEGKDNFTETIANLQLDFDQKMAELQETLNKTVENMDVSDEAYDVGKDNVKGLIDGAESMRQSLIDTYRSLAEDALAAYKKVMRQMSPSRAMREVGGYDVEGLILGAEEKQADLVRTYEALAASAVSAMERSLPSSTVEPARVSSAEQQAAVLVEALTGAKGVGGNTTVYITAPQAMDERTAAREFRRAQRDLALGIS